MNVCTSIASGIAIVTVGQTAWADEVAARPDSRVLAFDTGHWVMVEQPRQFNRAVAEWLAAGDAGPSP